MVDWNLISVNLPDQRKNKGREIEESENAPCQTLICDMQWDKQAYDLAVSQIGRKWRGPRGTCLASVPKIPEMLRIIKS